MPDMRLRLAAEAAAAAMGAALTLPELPGPRLALLLLLAFID